MKHNRMNACRIAVVTLMGIVAGCPGGLGGGGGGADEEGLPDLGLSNVKTENGAARSAVITPEGGTLSVTGSNGVVYTLTVPEGALLTDTPIGMYPISTLVNLPAGGTLTAGVHFTPEGETFLATPQLAVQVPAGIDPRELVGIAYDGNGEQLGLWLATVAGQTVTMPVPHFSGMALGNRQLNDLLETLVFSVRARQFRADLAAANNLFNRTGQDPRVTFTRLLRDWYTSVVRPALELPLSTAEFEYEAWLDSILFAQIVLLDASFTIAPELADSEPLAAAMLRTKYQEHNDLCEANATNPTDSDSIDFPNPLRFANQALAFGRLAERWHIPLVPNQLDRETLLNNLCVKVVIESASLPPAFGPGGLGNLDTRAGFRILGGPIRRSPTVNVKLSNLAPATASPTQVTTDATGLAISSIDWPVGLDPLSIDILARITGFSNIAVFDRITRVPASPFAGTYAGSSSGTAQTPNGEFGETGEFTVTVSAGGTLSATGTVTRNILGQTPGPVGFTATGTVTNTGSANLSGSAGSGQAACPFTFTGTFSLVGPDKVGGGVYDSNCGAGVTSHGEWSCETQ